VLTHKFTSVQIWKGVLQDDPKPLIFDLGDMQRPSPYMEEYIELQRGLSVKQILEFGSGKFEIF
jgi:hypothetical protein